MWRIGVEVRSYGFPAYRLLIVQNGFGKWALPAFFYARTRVVLTIFCDLHLRYYRGERRISTTVCIMSDYIIEEVENFARSLLPAMGLELVEVQFRHEGHGWVLRIFIDCEDGITVDHCADVSREVSDYLDVEDLIDHQYSLEVSSPGLERPLRSLADFERFAGRLARVKLRESIDGQKVFVGVIGKVEQETVELELEEGGSIGFAMEQLSKARLTI